MRDRVYIAIDLKAFYASVECVERGLDPLTTNLVVADESRTRKTICLAVTPSLKACGLAGRPRLFEVDRKVREVNCQRRLRAPHRTFSGESCDVTVLENTPAMAFAYITAVPRMALYIAYSARIYQIYLDYIAPEDIHVYSIDEVFMDVTSYLGLYGQTARELAVTMIRDVFGQTGITAAAGIGSNLYLAKVAMDIVAKKTPPDANGVRVAELDEMSYRRLLWSHRPLTDFWRVGRGYARRLEACGIMTMGDIARCSLRNESLLYRLFGVNAELLADHAWGWEPCTIADIKAYRPASNSMGSGQVLPCPYDVEKARLAVKEMVDLMTLDLVDRNLVADHFTLTVGYDSCNVSWGRTDADTVELVSDRYGKPIPKHAHGVLRMKRHTSSCARIMPEILELFDRIVNRTLLIRRLYLTANNVMPEAEARAAAPRRQLSLLPEGPAAQKKRKREKASLQKEMRRQKAILAIRNRYGKNAVLKGMNLLEGATTPVRNEQIGGHRA